MNKFAKIEELYLSYINDFLTVGRFAEYYSMGVEKAQRMLGIARWRRENRIELTFKVHGVYSWSNACGCEVEISKDCESARLRFPETGEITDWFEIETISDPDFDPDCDECDDEFIQVIDPEGHNIPLSLVMCA